jgi:hypothetical protein
MKLSTITLVGAACLVFAYQAGAVTIIDLVNGNTGTSNSTIFNWVDQQSVGTGVIDPFLRIQNNSGTEQGYNTSLATASAPWETKQGAWTHEIKMSDLTSVAIGSFTYFEFLLDINENKNATGRFISLNNVQIFTRPTMISSPAEDLSILGTLRYNMDVGAQGDTTVELDYSRNSGSGQGDMLMYVPTSLFAGASANDYVYFYSLFGIPNEVDAGFEEWAIRKAPGTQPPPPPSVPDSGATLALLGLAVSSLGMLRRKFVS